MDPEFLSLCRKVESVTWVIRIECTCKGVETLSYATGFSISSDGLIMTCAHIFLDTIVSIKVRRFGEDGFINDAELVDMRSTWDICLLKVKGIDGGDFGQFTENGSICQGQTLYLLGHMDGFVFSLFVGHVAYPCIDDVTFPSRGRTCRQYVCTALEVTPRYRIMGNFWNMTYFDRFGSQKFTYQKNLNALIPVIQCTGFSCNDACSGGPVFNSAGDIVGMMIGEAAGCQIAIHVTALKEFLKVSTQAEKRKAEDIGGASVKDFSKGVKKRKD